MVYSNILLFCWGGIYRRSVLTFGFCRCLCLSVFVRVCVCVSINHQICRAKHRVMLPKPRLVEPGPARCTWKTKKENKKKQTRPGQHGPLFCTDPNLFHSIQFPIFNYSVCLDENLAELSPCTVPLAIVNCNQNKAAHQTNPQHDLLRCRTVKTLSGIYATDMVKLTNKMDEICISGKFSVQRPNE